MECAVHKIGASLALSGPVKIGGNDADLTDWTAASTLRGRGFESRLACELTIAAGKTTLTVTAAPDDQGHWRAGEAEMDVKLISPQGYTLITSSARLTLQRAVTEG